MPCRAVKQWGTDNVGRRLTPPHSPDNATYHRGPRDFVRFPSNRIASRSVPSKKPATAPVKASLVMKFSPESTPQADEFY